jgi:hypothetical protein
VAAAAPRRPSPPCGEPSLAKALGDLDLLAVGSLPVGPRHLEQRGQLLEARLGEKGAQAGVSQLALTEVRVAISVGAQGDGGVVHVQAAQSVEADLGIELIEHLAQRLGGADLEPGGEQVAAVYAHPEPAIAPRELEQANELVEVAPQGPLGAGGVLEQQRT